MILLALDPNTINTGWCMYNTDNGHTHAGELSTPKGTKKNPVSLNDRKRAQRAQLMIIIHNFGDVDHTIIEDVHYAGNFTSPIKIARFADYIIADNTQTWEYMAPATWRSQNFKTNKRNDTDTFKVASAFIGRDCKSIDEATAICIMIAYLKKNEIDRFPDKTS